MGKIQVTCGFCQAPVFKPKKEYDRQVRAGRTDFFCNLGCAASFGNHAIDGKLRGLLRGNPRPQLDDLSPFRWFVLRARSRPEKGPTDLTPEFLRKVFEAQDGECPLTGWKLVLPRDTKGFGQELPENASLDRIHNDVGYVTGNVRFVSVMANIARAEHSDEDLRRFCHSVVMKTCGKKPGIAALLQEQLVRDVETKLTHGL